MHPDLGTDITTVLEEAQTAHSVYEMESMRGVDEEWPAWYATYLLDLGLRDLLPKSVTGDPDTLAARLQDLHAAFQRDDPSGDWHRFCAERFVASERDSFAAVHNHDR